ncbi:alpha hydrolase [Methanohalophilus sp.]|uniref:DUF7411 family protein n=1 Tax=Methanohalophilus sp. TaxID=1966352 RepID=UPI002635E474|nr:alpha hydrolase [Methanohalophilus sp.]MDK2892040.1 tRNA methyltransferase [Methanohalophilus sp.]
MKARILFSGGKDSSLSALLLESFFDVELVTCTFSLAPVVEIAAEVAAKLGFKHSAIEMDMSVLDEAFQLILDDGYPRHAINHIHLEALEKVASLSPGCVIADGIRRDDIAPRPDQSSLRSIEDRFGVFCVSPLLGYGRAAVNDLVNRYLVIEEDLSDRLDKADYETELRQLIRDRCGDEKVKEIFPEHIQSRVISRK